MVFRAGLWVLGVKAPSVPLGQLPRERGSGVSQKLPLPLPRFRGFGACADAGEAGEGVFPLRSALVPILVTQPQFQVCVRPLGRQVSVFCENGSPRDAAKLRT